MVEERLNSQLKVINQLAKVSDLQVKEIENLRNEIEKMKKENRQKDIEILHHLHKLKGELNGKISREDAEKLEYLHRQETRETL